MIQQILIDALEGLIESESAEQTDEAVKHAKSVIERARRDTVTTKTIIRLIRKVSKEISPGDFAVTHKSVDIEFMGSTERFNPYAEITPETLSDILNNDVVAVEIVHTAII